ncbi:MULTISPECIES: hypothetical protein [Cyanophyceae]|uniref:hypothetical protein n=1 Tax=Cyanophyceae TaxID=3028117 RepID=UPI00168430FE|nr:hypothetical protein [Trichocoleus sp. FACHB-40]MBD2003003.1 hypothetical protein [Trichocoleus sp. FACHB-40]
MNKAKGNHAKAKEKIFSSFSLFLVFTVYFLLPRSVKADELPVQSSDGAKKDSEFEVQDSDISPIVEETATEEATTENLEVLPAENLPQTLPLYGLQQAIGEGSDTAALPLNLLLQSESLPQQTQAATPAALPEFLQEASLSSPRFEGKEGNQTEVKELAQSQSPSNPIPQETQDSTKEAPTNSELRESVSQTNAQAEESGNESTLSPTEVRILAPKSKEIGARSTNLVVQYNSQSQIQVTVNKKPLDPKIRSSVERNEAQNITTQVWYNIPLEKGENAIAIQAAQGTPVTLQLNVKDTTERIQISPVGDARVRADGRSTIKLEGKITDENGELIREDAVVTLTASAGKFIGADDDKDLPGFQVVAKEGQFAAELQSGLEAQKVRIRAATTTTEKRERIEEINRTQENSSTPTALPPLTENRAISPEVGGLPRQSDRPINPQVGLPTQSDYLLPTKQANYTNELETFTQVEFITNLRPSIASGVINLRIGSRGTNYWGSRRDFLDPDTIDEGMGIDLSAAVFATGKVGEWLFTGAYNSARNLNETCDGITRLFRGPQFCEQQYPVYGDSSTVDYLTPSTDSVYLRMERTSPVPGSEPDYGMWGDYNTTEFSRASQLYSATNRQLHGFKGNYNLGNLQITALYSPDVEGFQRDTIAPSGTSGYYFLSRRLLIPGSENVFVETEEINRPGTVTSRKQLFRGADYEIDYDRGTLLFRRPVFATEFDPFGVTQVRRIVVTYQHEATPGDSTNIYAGRLQYNFSQEFGQQSWLGASYWRQDEGAQDFELYGADFLVPLGKDGQIVGEYAHSRNNNPFLGNVTGNAYRLEAYGAIARTILARGYYRSVEEGFANNATTSFTPGQTRYGASIATQVTTTTQVSASYDHEINFGIAPAERINFFDIFDPQPQPIPGERVDNSLTTIRAGVLQRFGAADLSLEYVNRSRDDRLGDTFDSDASQIVSRANIPLSRALTFRAQNELNLDDSDPLYPNRTTFGLDYEVMEGVSLRLAHQFVNTRVFGRDSISSLDTIVEQKIGENTSITGRYSIISGFNSITGQGAVGLNHTWAIAPGLRVLLGYEHIFSDQFGRTAAGQRFAQPYATGQSASALGIVGGDAYSVGLEYTDNPNFQASARVEHRTGSGGNNTVIAAGAAGKLSPSLTALFRYQQANGANQLLRALGDTVDIKLGMAYRNPVSDKFNALLSYEYRRNPSTIPETLLLGTGTGYTDHVFAAEAIYAPSWRWEFYGKGAVRQSETYLSNNFSNSSTVFLTQMRVTYRLGYRWDVAGEGRWIGQPDVNFNETGFAVEAGYYVTPDLRASLGYSFGSVDDRDFSGYRSDGGIYFGLTLKVNELFGGFGRQKVAPPQQQESLVQPVATESQE